MKHLFLLLFIFTCIGCSNLNNMTTSIITGQLKTVNVLSVSGLGLEPKGIKQIEDRIIRECPTVHIIESHWSYNLNQEVATFDSNSLIVVSHSYGGGAVVYAFQSDSREVYYLFLLDPVAPPLTKPDNTLDFTLPKNILNAECWNRTKFQLFVASSSTIKNPNEKYINHAINKYHNSIPEDKAIQDKIIETIISKAQIQMGVPLPSIKQLITPTDAKMLIKKK